MAGTVTRGPDGLRLSMPDGTSVPWVLPESHLAELGYDVPPAQPGLTDPSRGALAEFKPSDYKGPGSFTIGPTKPEMRSDVPDIGGVASSALAPYRTEKTAEEKQEATRANRQDAAVARSNADEGKPQTGLRGGAKVVSMPDAPARAAGPTMPAGHLVKGGDKRVGFGITRSNLPEGAIEEAEGAEADASIDRKLAAQKLSDIQQASYEKHAALLEGQNQAEAESIERQRRKNQAIATDMQSRQTAIDAEREAVDKLKVNPNEYFEQRGPLAAFLSGIAVLGGGIVQGLRGGENPGVAIIERAINRNIDAQKHNIALRQQGLRAKETELERLTQLFGTPQAAEAELRDRMRLLAQRMTEQDVSQSGAQSAPALLQAQFADWDHERAQNRLKLAQDMAGSIQEHWQNIPDRVVGAPVLKPEQRERLVTFDGGNGRGFVVAGNAREKVQDGITGFENIMGSIGELEQLASQANPTNLEAQRKYDALRSNILAEVNVRVGQGAISKDDGKRVEAALPDVTDWTTTRDGAVTRLRQERAWAHSRRNAFIRDNVYADPNAAQPMMSGQPTSARQE